MATRPKTIEMRPEHWRGMVEKQEAKKTLLEEMQENHQHIINAINEYRKTAEKIRSDEEEAAKTTVRIDRKKIYSSAWYKFVEECIESPDSPFTMGNYVQGLILKPESESLPNKQVLAKALRAYSDTIFMAAPRAGDSAEDFLQNTQMLEQKLKKNLEEITSQLGKKEKVA